VVLDLKQVDLKQVRDEVADRVTRAAKELGSGAGSAARELGATAEQSLNTQIRKQTASAKRRLPRRGGPGRLTVLAGALARNRDAREERNSSIGPVPGFVAAGAHSIKSARGPVRMPRPFRRKW